ncbi:GPP34 family phosphoprotein [Kitasatospora sp. SUK 42]|uniref:GOLPH3/VPS74 family protein n=1 Tax=Kitasatospora sp. SUK 42 TaxID=1588882 RepID=UPI0018C9D6B9|nr:GPP34 family phosphoprotein [Kitasatospora sp. SUK 42]MBV2154075.1 GPP34 family phosphoprotein [Kitasatospora sp. SUK 42]
MTSADIRPLPEELLLLCADPARGRFLNPSSHLNQVIAGAVLAELLLTGAITVEKQRITGYQPFGATDEVAAGVLARLESKGKSRFRPWLFEAVRWIPERPGYRFHLDRLVAQGYYTVEEKRFLGLPVRRHLPTRPDLARQTAARVAATLLARDGGAGRPTAERDRQLAGLIDVAGLERRLYPGRDGAPIRRAAGRLARELPVPQAVRKAVERMSGN